MPSTKIEGPVAYSNNVDFTLLPTSASTPTVGTELITKSYADTSYASAQITASVTTTNATPTVLASVSLPSFDAVVTISGTVNGQSGFSSVGGTFVATAYWDWISFTLTTIGTPFVVLNTNASASFNIINTSNSLRIMVTGIVANTFSWSTSYSVKIN